ncbi:oligosaccharide flippase family protein, partial [bacterium]|nr:oligosaccharide flippase family protein [bacterium]
MSSSLTGGATLLALHQAFALVATSLLQVIAARYLGPQVYGVFSIVQAVIALLLFTALTGVPHAVATVAATDSAFARSSVRTGLGLQAAIGVSLGVSLYLLADPLAARLGDPLHADLLRWAALVVPLTGIPYVWIFALNGLHRFGRQSASLILLTGTKSAAVILVLVVGGGAIAAMQGIVVAAAVAAIGAAILARGLPGSQRFPARDLAGRSVQLGATYVAVAVWD